MAMDWGRDIQYYLKPQLVNPFVVTGTDTHKHMWATSLCVCVYVYAEHAGAYWLYNVSCN